MFQAINRNVFSCFWSITCNFGSGILAFAFFLAISHHTLGQEIILPRFKPQNFSVASGLCHSSIRVLAKDKSGYLWIGTTNGLSRFDGNRFTNFFHDPTDSKSLGHNFVQEIVCDKKGNTWVLHIMGLSLYNPENQHFTTYSMKSQYPHISGEFTSLAEDGNGNLWVGNQNGLTVFDTKSRQYLAPDQLNHLLFREDLGFRGNRVNGIKRGDKGTMWVNTPTNIYLWDPGQRKTFEFGMPPIVGLNHSFAIQFVDTLNTTLYIGTFTKGLLLFNYKDKKWKQISSGPESMSTSTYDPVLGLCPYANHLWAYISELGIGFFDEKNSHLVPLLPVPFSKDKNLVCLLTDNNHIWVGTDNGLVLLLHEKLGLQDITPPNRYQGAFNTVQVHPIDPFVYTGNYSYPAVYKTPSGGGNKTNLDGILGYLRYFFRDSQGNEWISTEDAIYRKENGDAKWMKIPVENTFAEPIKPLPRNFAEDANGTIWVRVRNLGVFSFNREKQAFVLPKEKGLPRQGRFSGLLYNPATKTIWLSEENTGLYALVVGSQKWAHHALHLANTPLSPARIALGRNGAIAFPDPFNGIGIYFPNTKKIKWVSQADGLLSNNVSSIDVDEEGNFWTLSTEGISKIMATDYAVATYKHPSLVRIQEIACGRDGMEYIATAEGLFRLEGRLLKPEKPNGDLRLDKITVMGIPYPLAGNLQLSPNQTDIEIKLSYVDLYSGTEPLLEYRFDNEKTWKSLGDRNTLSLSRLSPGNYNLIIRLRKDTNPLNWQKFSWAIARPVWQRPFFLILTLVLAGAVVYYFTQRRISSIREKAALQQKISETEMAALQAQMNPHFIFNCINCIDAMVQEGDKYSATTYLNKFAKLLRNVLEGSRKPTVPLQSDLETLRLYLELECMRMDDAFNWEIDLQEKVAAADIRVPSLIIQPYVENAILHGLRHLTGKKGKLRVALGLCGDILVYSITDNGVGRQFTQTMNNPQRHSLGMEITRERIELFNRNHRGSVSITDLKDALGGPQGTLVKVQLPLK